jgi:hypothetical protein
LEPVLKLEWSGPNAKRLASETIRRVLVSVNEDTVKAMPVDFEPETDLDAFQEKLKDAIE